MTNRAEKVVEKDTESLTRLIAAEPVISSQWERLTPPKERAKFNQSLATNKQYQETETDTEYCLLLVCQKKQMALALMWEVARKWKMPNKGDSA